MRFLLAVFAWGLLSFAGFVAAQSFPAKPVTLIVPFAAGGPTDGLARILAEPMKQSIGQPILVENVTGAGGTIGLTRAARAAPDGYTVILGNWTSHVGTPALFPIQVDVLKDFEPVARLPVSRLWITGKTGLPAKDAAELVAWLKNGAKATFGTVGPGSAVHICGIYLQNSTGTHFQFVPYRGAAPAYQDLIAGNIDLTCMDASNGLAYHRAGRIKAYAVAGNGRWSPAPEVPTLSEAGVAGMDLTFWNGLWAPKDTPKEAIAKLNHAVAEAFVDAKMQQRMADLGMEIPPREQQTPEALGAWHKAETEKWWPIIKAAGIRLE
ncbi:MAG TPA: tripartite tricarboxylate transporter substrate-binding protein [Burkholderiales bacterium]|jgi:tripartite-type tricarboxylate transporter receptor subunit TctC|nr:tripartite tricarboxylate transporter substrate-binding protein [Burkholderiales bacterium]